MRDDEPFTLEPGWRAEHVRSVTAGGHVTILIRGIAVLGFDSKDKVHRDIVIATLLKAELPGKQTAALCGVTESHVTWVRQKYADGGMQALMVRPRHGAAPRVITEKQTRRVLDLRRRGMAVEVVARATKVPLARVREIVAAAGMGGRGSAKRPPPEQLELNTAPANDDEWAEAPKRPAERRVSRGPATDRRPAMQDLRRARVPRNALEPSALRAFLRTSRRDLVVPLKYAADNAVRELVHRFGAALSTTEADHDATTRARTLLALLQAPGTIRFGDDDVTVTLELPLPPSPHQRLGDALIALDDCGMRFTDGVRRLRVRLVARPTRRTVTGSGSGRE